MSSLAPPELGRGVVVAAGAAAPHPWASAPRVVVDEGALGAPETVVAELHEAWRTRTPVVIELAVDHQRVRAPVDHPGPAWRYPATFTAWHDRLHFLCWANTYDARTDGRLRWWWADRAVRLGARPVGDAGDVGDVVLPDGRVAWVDGGPREPLDPDVLGAVVVHRDSVELERLTVAAPPAPLPDSMAAHLAPDQLAAVAHRPGAARILAPAGSGKTRVLTERLRLLRSWGWERDAVLAVAYNVRAREELVERTSDFQPRVQTLNSLGYAVLRAARGDLTVIDEREVRRLVSRLAPPQQRRANTDPLLPYLDALSLCRLSLRDPAAVEDERDDVPGFAELLPRYRATLADGGMVDYDEQILGAAEVLLGDGAFRRDAQGRWGRHLLVDEFQDLTPAHLLLLRLLAAPALDLFGVGDDDQVIYGHAGADPAFLVDYATHVPGAATHALVTNYRCPRAVVRGAHTLLGYNRRRVEKTIEPGPDADDRRDALDVRTCPPETRLTELVDVVRGHLDADVAPADIAVLARVNAQLLAPHVALTVAGIPVTSNVGPQLLERTGARAALAYLRLAGAADMATTDLLEVYRRPSRALPQWFPERLEQRATWSVSQLRALADRVGDRYRDKVLRFVSDLEAVRRAGGDTAGVLRQIRTTVGLGRAADLLDGTRTGGSGSHGDDLDALEQVAALHPDPVGFEPWLRAVLDAAPPGATTRGVTVSTIHRVKGLEWDHVVVHGVDDGLLPHRLSDDVEEERRVLHVAVTRCRHSVVLLADAERPSPFLDELLGLAPHRRATGPTPPRGTRATRATPARPRPARREPGVEAAPGLHLTVLGGFTGEIEALEDDGVVLRTEQGGALRVRWDERVTVDGHELRLRQPGGGPSDDGRTDERVAALKAWRLQRSRTDGVPAFVVLNDRYLDGIAVRRPSSLHDLADCDGIGPRKLELYGEEILEVLADLR